ncbi:MAG: hypothetical protein PUB08_00985, partial [Firmicutes bacterium]|nr:hypothetical protein [Bacillota bacterium]
MFKALQESRNSALSAAVSLSEAPKKGYAYLIIKTNLLTFQQVCGILALVETSTSAVNGGADVKERFETFTVLINRISRSI